MGDEAYLTRRRGQSQPGHAGGRDLELEARAVAHPQHLGEDDPQSTAMGQDQGVRRAGPEERLPAVEYPSPESGEGLGPGGGVAHRVVPETGEQSGGNLVGREPLPVTEAPFAEGRGQLDRQAPFGRQGAGKVRTTARRGTDDVADGWLPGRGATQLHPARGAQDVVATPAKPWAADDIAMPHQDDKAIRHPR